MMTDLDMIVAKIDAAIASTSRRNLHGVDLARIALAAIRTPTTAMEAAFYAACDEHGNCLWRYGHKAMIDALLAPPLDAPAQEVGRAA